MRTRDIACTLSLLFVPSLCLGDGNRPARPDIRLPICEGPDDQKWKATGEAFGSAPAQGTLPGQMAVSGYLGKRLVKLVLPRR